MGDVLILCYTKENVASEKITETKDGTKIIYKNYKACSDEALIAEQYSLQKNKLLTVHQTATLNSVISDYTTGPNNLMIQHSNLEMIEASSVISTTLNGYISEPCIVLYCRSKSYVPIGEKLFPTHLKTRQGNMVKTDVREGYFMLCPRGGAAFLDQSTEYKKELSMGHSIGPANTNVSATVGIFVRVEGTVLLAPYDTFLTASHTFWTDSLNVDGAIDSTVVQPADGELPTNSLQQDRTCGTVKACIFDHQADVGVDVALVQISEDRIPTRANFAEVTENALQKSGFSQKNYPTFDDGSTKDATKFTTEDDATARVIKFWKTTGLTKGTFRLHETAVKITVLNSEQLLMSQLNKSFVMKGQLVIESNGLDNIFFQAGDSGAAVFQVDSKDRLHFIGMAIGMTSIGTCIVTPAEPILEHLRHKLNAHVSIRRFDTDNEMEH